jgi:hypothetical protein
MQLVFSRFHQSSELPENILPFKKQSVNIFQLRITSLETRIMVLEQYIFKLEQAEKERLNMTKMA